MWKHRVPRERDLEYDHLVKSTQALERLTGRRPVGTRSHHTPALLTHLGYIYTSTGTADHLPYCVADTQHQHGGSPPSYARAFECIAMDDALDLLDLLISDIIHDTQHDGEKNGSGRFATWMLPRCNSGMRSRFCWTTLLRPLRCARRPMPIFHVSVCLKTELAAERFQDFWRDAD